jgi:hypothetical protein
MNVNDESERTWKEVAMASKSDSLWAGLLGFDPSRGNRFSLCHYVQISSGAHPVSYQMGTEGCFLRGKTAGAYRRPQPSIWCWGLDCREIFHHAPYTPLWHGVWAARRNLTFTLYTSLREQCMHHYLPIIYLLHHRTLFQQNDSSQRLVFCQTWASGSFYFLRVSYEP